MEVKHVRDLMEAYSSVYSQSEETLDENVQDAVKGALEAGAKFMKTNPVGKVFGKVIAPAGNGKGTVTAAQQKQTISQNEEFDQVDEGRNTSLQALSRESEKRKADKKRGRPETESEIHSRLMMGKFRPGASQEERAEGGRQVLRDRGKVPKKGGKDMFEHVLEYLVAEGYADTNESALVIMANMSEEWRQSIVEAREKPPQTVASMRAAAAERRKKRYGASDTSRGGRDDFAPITDYEAANKKWARNTGGEN